jgi:hypothetical protein
MRPTLKTRILLAAVLTLPITSTAQTTTSKPGHTQQQSQSNPTVRAVRLVKAFVVDDRLSVLRRESDVRSQVVQRLRLGRPVYIIGSSIGAADQPKCYRVAVTRRTRGWIHKSAVAIPGRAGEDKRLFQLAENASDGFDRIVLWLLLTESFRSSPLVPRALLAMAAEAERVAPTLSKRAAKHAAPIDPKTANASLRDYYLNDVVLDRYSKLRISFDFDEAAGQYIYDGGAYRAIIKRFPSSEAAKIARERLKLMEQQLARCK